MKQSYLKILDELFPRVGIVRRFTFKTMATRDESALLAAENHQLSMGSDPLREESAHFRKQDCFECISPHVKASARAAKRRSVVKAA